MGGGRPGPGRMASVPWLLGQRELGLLPDTPRALSDRALVAPLVCTADDDYQSISPDMENPHVNPEPPTYALNFCPVAGSHHLLAIANEDGALHVQDTSRVLPKLPLTGRRCHENAIFAFCWSERDANRMVTASGDQTVGVWDLQAPEGDPVRRLRGHGRSVKAVEWRPGTDHEFASAGRDNAVLVWDLRRPGDEAPENAIRSAHTPPGTAAPGRRRAASAPTGPDRGPACSVTGLCWLDGRTLASVGDSDGRVKLWDLRKHYSLYKGEPLPMAELPHPGTSSNRGFTTLSASPTSSHIYVSCMDSNIYQYDVVNAFQQPTAVFTGAHITNFFIKHSVSPCGRYLASGSADQWCHVWHTASPGGPVARLGPQEAEVTCVSWAAGPGGAGPLLAAASDDMRHRLWRDARRLPGKDEVRGRAEMLGKLDTAGPTFVSPARRPAGERASRTPHRTPGSAPRRQTPSIAAYLTPRQKAAAVDETKSPHRTPTNEVKRGLKRRAVDFNDENCEPQPKKTPRGLAESLGSLLSSPSARCTFSAASYRSPTKRLLPASPRRLGSPLKGPPLTPLRSNLGPALACLASPTANLPNLAVDGRSPRLRPGGGAATRPQARTRDWLTEMARRRQQADGKPVKKPPGKKKIVKSKKV